MLSFAKQSLVIAWLVVAGWIKPVPPTNIYVSPAGSPSNSGTISSPLDLATVFTKGKIAPGSTVWLRGGTYSGPFWSFLDGTTSAPIIVQGYPNERATLTTQYQYLDMGVLNVYGSNTIYRDFEVTVDNAVRTYSYSFRPMGVQVQAPNTKFIDLVVHDTGMGFGFWEEATNSELYGNIIYNCGTQNTMSDKRHGHGIYVQNVTGTKSIRDNIVFNQFGWGIHAYGGDQTGLYLDGNIVFNNGVLSAPVGPFNNILVSGAVANNIVLTSNYTYRSMSAPYHEVFSDADLCLGCTHQITSGSLVLEDNYFAGGTPSGWIFGFQNVAITRNTFVGMNAFLGFLAPYGATLMSSQNTYDGAYPPPTPLFSINGQGFDIQAWRSTKEGGTSQFQYGYPSGTKVALRKNAYDSTRSHLVIYNWAHSDSVAVDLSSVLAKGSAFEIRNVQDYYGAPVLSGTYNGGTVAVPMAGLHVAAPLGYSAPPPSWPEFNAFVVIQN